MMVNGGGGPGAADPRGALVSTGDNHFAAGTVAVFSGTRPPMARALAALLPVPDRMPFRIAGGELSELDVPRGCWDGGPVNAIAIDTVIAFNAGLDEADIGYPFYAHDAEFRGWREAPDRTEIERHRANCLVTLRWTMRAMAVASAEQMPGLQRLRSAAVSNLRFEARRKQVERVERLEQASTAGKARGKAISRVAEQRAAELRRQYLVALGDPTLAGDTLRSDLGLDERIFYEAERTRSDLVIHALAERESITAKRMRDIIKPTETRKNRLA